MSEIALSVFAVFKQNVVKGVGRARVVINAATKLNCVFQSESIIRLLFNVRAVMNTLKLAAISYFKNLACRSCVDLKNFIFKRYHKTSQG